MRVYHVTQDALVHGLGSVAHVLHIWIAFPRVEGSGVSQKLGRGQRTGREKLLGLTHTLTLSGHILRLCSIYKEAFLGKIRSLRTFLGMLKTCCAG